ncbi:hypothetical protein KZ813_00055 [Sphingomonas sp. RHCKR7]|uniref:hypothetical protein n=1 Tax=Sphingomonas folli TaxID=2862497 RepID=UPI001CA5C6F6|nr:hypothetical protein [Sphingomonas folli]MBW6525229.1 hypothetical protein [Sphingomonas folli]
MNAIGFGFAVLALVGFSANASAQQGYSPPNTYFTGTGSINMSKKEPGSIAQYWACSLTITAHTGTALNGKPDRSGTIFIDSLSTANNNPQNSCAGVRFEPTTISAKDPRCVAGGVCEPYKSGVLNGLVAYVPNTKYGGESQFCGPSSDKATVEFENNGTSPSRIGMYGPLPTWGCYIQIVVTVSPDINFVQ